MSQSHKSPSRWEKLHQTTQAKTVVFELQSVHYRHPARATERDFVVLRTPDWVNVIALTPDGRLVLVRQFRFGIDGFSLEVPGGVMKVGEDPIEAGLRELREETGFTGVRARLLGSVQPNPAIQSNQCHIMVVEEAVRTAELEWDADEEIEVTALPVDEVFALARNGTIAHGLVLNALFLFEPFWHERKRGGV